MVSNNTHRLQFDKGIMKLYAYDPFSNQYKTRILTLPELPSFEPLEYLFNNESISSCNDNKLIVETKHSENNKSPHHPIQVSPYHTKEKIVTTIDRPTRPKRTLSDAFHAAFSGFIHSNKKSQNCWKAETCFIELRVSAEKSTYPLQHPCENWWMSSPSIHSF
ncbi:uncharacterized protein BX663DRAFT_526774 [Cokeromyces recurvatus]|uniref:uncharacterized protein n=1 Tax=Cokeromyces recurvatus TaxID=90255 RepID=UPI0022202376|nr:uncharacterized protein BX663DRAFT_526774 [Cokeromyces recurvatus]KAI7897880.1 hypothetical protein BX663DRAFT_526774 [Cokeromyces recurvatus]